MPELFINFETQNLKEFYGHNTIEEILKLTMPHVDTLIFLEYHYIDGFPGYNKFYIENFLNSVFNSYSKINKKNSIDFSLKTKKFNYLSNKHRPARLLTSSWLANNYNNYSEFNYSQSYSYCDFSALLNEFIFVESLPLESKILPKKWITVDASAEKYIENQHAMSYLDPELNFYNGLKNQILPTVFSVVIEPVFFENSCMLTEKYINAVFGGTIPIINGYRVYEVLKEMGFDTFDDIIDTSAQFEKNSVLRIINLLEKNKDRLNDAFNIVKNKSIQTRINNNLRIAKTYDYNLYKKRYPADTRNYLEKFKNFKFIE